VGGGSHLLITLNSKLLQQLSAPSDISGADIEWLPLHNLPKHVRLVITCSTGPLLDRILKVAAPEVAAPEVAAATLVEVGPMSEPQRVLAHLLAARGRSISPEQVASPPPQLSSEYGTHKTVKARL